MNIFSSIRGINNIVEEKQTKLQCLNDMTAVLSLDSVIRMNTNLFFNSIYEC